jgi:hypothetical protein
VKSGTYIPFAAITPSESHNNVMTEAINVRKYLFFITTPLG